MTTEIQVYGTAWCRLTFGVREYLTNSRVDYDYIDIERDPEGGEFVRTVNAGRLQYPVVVVAEQAVTNPTLAELGRILREQRLDG